MSKNFLKIAFALAVLAGCSFKQNPLADLPNSIIDKPDVDEKPKAGPEEAIRPDVLDSYSLKVGTPFELTFDGRVLIPNYKLTADVKNLESFPGATYDETTRTFKWTPTSDYMAGDLKREVNVLVIYVADDKAGKSATIVREKEIKLVIERMPGSPQIIGQTGFPDNVQEGRSAQMTLTVEDPDAGKTAEKYPQLLINAGSKGAGLEPYIRVDSVEKLSDTQFLYNIILDLTGVEITTSLRSFEVQFAPRSQYGTIGGSKTWEVDIYTSLKEPVITWDTNTTMIFKVGESKTYNFQIFDLREEGKLSLDNSPSVPSGADLSCNKTNEYVLNCSLTWAPTEDQIGYERLSLHVNSKFEYNWRIETEENFYYELDLEAVAAEGTRKAQK